MIKTKTMKECILCGNKAFKEIGNQSFCDTHFELYDPAIKSDKLVNSPDFSNVVQKMLINAVEMVKNELAKEFKRQSELGNNDFVANYSKTGYWLVDSTLLSINSNFVVLENKSKSKFCTCEVPMLNCLTNNCDFCKKVIKKYKLN